ncbi:NAD(P)/FAD-dependent oxidoreductase [Colwellia sp. MEBiC06753]
MSKEIAVLGAGMVGVSIAWHLQKEGYQVTLIDRKPPGNETSFGNAGLIQREAIRPYAFPRSIAKLLKVLPNNQIDIRYQCSETFKQIKPLFSYWYNSHPKRYKKICHEYATIIEPSLDAHQEMIQASNAESFIAKRGYLEIYRTKQAFEQRCKEVNSYIEGSGVEAEFLTSEALAKLEPAIQSEMAGAIHWRQVWAARSPHDLVNAYFQQFVHMGGQFVEAEIKSLQRLENCWRIQVKGQVLEFEQAVLSLGPWSAKWLKQQGLSIPLFFKKGYHIHFQQAGTAGLKHTLIEAETGFVMAPMPSGIRICTGAHFSGLEADNNYEQLTLAEQKSRAILKLGQALTDKPWSGARPCLPDMKPIIGPAPNHNGLWLAFGHGHQGFTLGPITGRLITQMIAGKATDIDTTPFRADRF